VSRGVFPPYSPRRRDLLAGAGAAAAGTLVPALAQTSELPQILALQAYLAGRRPQFGRMQMDLPRVADNGNSVPIKLGVLGASKPGAVKTIHLFSERNPVPQMAVFHFAPDTTRFDIESRVRLAGTQRVVALATMSDDTLLVKVAEVLVAIAACLDGS
jgi:sulfur-oxidizing protein SoxY